MIKTWLDDDAYHLEDCNSGELYKFETLNELLAMIVRGLEELGIDGERVSVPVVIFEPTATRDGSVYVWGENWNPEKLKKRLPTEMGDT